MENQTLIITLALVSGCASLALVLNWLGNRHIPGLARFALGFLTISAGILLLGTQDILPPLLSIMLANGLILVGQLPIMFGLAEFWNQENSRLPLICTFCFSLLLVALYYFTFLDDSILARVRIVSVLMVLACLCDIYLVVNGLKIERILRPAMTVGTHYGALLAIVLFAVVGVGQSLLMFIRDADSLTAPDLGTTIMLLGGVFTMIVLAFAIILMTMDELSVELRENSLHDPITTILNHRSFVEVSNRLLGVEYRNQNPVSLVTLIIDNMDEIIRRYGHKIVNEMLRYFAIMASDRRRAEDVIARSSFNKFRMLLPKVDEDRAQVAVNSILTAQRQEPFLHEGQPVDVSFRICAITKSAEDLDLHIMLQESEVTLEHAEHHKMGESAAAVQAS